MKKQEMIPVNVVYEVVCKRAQLAGCDGAVYQPLENNFWRQLRDEEIAACIRGLFTAEEQARISTKVVKEVIAMLREDPFRRIVFSDQFEVNRSLVWLNNGLFDMGNMQFIANHGVMSNVCFRYGYDFSYLASEYRRETPAFDKFLSTSLPDQADHARVYEFIALILTKERPKTAFFFLGASDSGKSVLATFIASLVLPRERVSAVPFSRFSNVFDLEKLARATLNVVTEVSENGFSSSVVDVFKKVCARESITVAQKYHAPYTAKFDTTLLACANTFPKVAPEDVEAVLNRVEAICFPRSIAKEDQDPYLLQHMLGERDTICSRALDVMFKLRQNAYKLTPSYGSDQFVESVNMSRPEHKIKEFLENFCLFTENANIPTADFLLAFRVFCEEDGYENKFPDSLI